MSPVAEDRGFVGVNWGSARFRAYRVLGDGRVLDEVDAPTGVAGLDRAGMASVMDALVERWPDHGPIYACGMVGSNIGWVEAPYAAAPVSVADLVRAVTPTRIGAADVLVVPGVACRRAFDGTPDIMRGEEVELVGVAALKPGFDGLVAMAGAHTKWVRVRSGRVGDFLTSMSGEIFDRLTAAGLLASIVAGEAADGPAFLDGVAAGHARRLGLAALLFGARARVMRGDLERADAASYVRGLLIGSEIADAITMHPDLAKKEVALVGGEGLCLLYERGLRFVGATARHVDARKACVRGFAALHAACRPRTMEISDGPDPSGE